VWLARDTESNSLVALKRLAPHVAADRATLGAFERITTRIAALDDPNILRVHEVINADADAWLVMEYATRGDLSALRGRSCEVVLRLVLPIARVLGDIHRAGIVHRDVKTSNILLMDDGTPRLADFGAALAVGEAPGAMTQGSLYTMSPESLDGLAVTPAVDVYGFGAMLYELLTGYPPFYPHATPARIRTEAPARISAGGALLRSCARDTGAPARRGVPVALAELIAWCLRKSPAERPSSMEVVATQLRLALTELSASPVRGARLEPMSTNEPNNDAPPRVEAPIIRPPSMSAEPLRGEWRRASERAPDPAELRKQGFRRGLTVAAIALGAVAVFLVFFALPNWVGTTPPAQYRQAASPAKVEQPKAPPKEVDFAALARAKQQADEVREPLVERLEKLRERGVEQWAVDEYQAANTELAAGDERYAKREYVEAAQHFEKLQPMLGDLESRAGEVLKTQLAGAARALSEGRSEDAKAAFALALKIEPKNAIATRGLERAGTLDRVLALLATAERAEQDGNSTAALADYRAALGLDKDTAAASEGIARVSARVAGDAFASAMARGFDQLGAANYAAARAAFEAAGNIRPHASEVADALKQVEQSERTRTIAGKLAAARESETQERWAEALKTYQDILVLDSTVIAASEGKARVQPRTELNQQLELYLTQPERLFSAPVRVAARQSLERASAIQNPGPLLTQQMGKLREWLVRADVPVQVALQSDNLTQVTLFRVGALGAFEQRSLELAPGEYTLLGTRPGFRDVRRQIMVVPGTPMQPVVIRCEDKI
jgi:eukaryotic-like serine/threonine-protein kinase